MYKEFTVDMTPSKARRLMEYEKIYPNFKVSSSIQELANEWFDKNLLDGFKYKDDVNMQLLQQVIDCNWDCIVCLEKKEPSLYLLMYTFLHLHPEDTPILFLTSKTRYGKIFQELTDELGDIVGKEKDSVIEVKTIENYTPTNRRYKQVIVDNCFNPKIQMHHMDTMDHLKVMNTRVLNLFYFNIENRMFSNDFNRSSIINFLNTQVVLESKDYSTEFFGLNRIFFNSPELFSNLKEELVKAIQLNRKWQRR